MEANSCGNEPAKVTHIAVWPDPHLASTACPVPCIQEKKHACLSPHCFLWPRLSGFLIGCKLLEASLRMQALHISYRNAAAHRH